MVIGIDIDGVLMDDDTYRLDHIAKYCYENNLPEMDRPYNYEIKCTWGVSTIEDYDKKYYEDYIKNTPAKAFAAEIIKKLHNEGNKIIIITGRDYEYKQEIEEWLDRNNIIYDELCIVYPKTNTVKEKNVNVMIEDCPDLIPDIAKVSHVFCYDNRYNVNLECENMTRVFSWYDIYSKIKRKSINIRS